MIQELDRLALTWLPKPEQIRTGELKETINRSWSALRLFAVHRYCQQGAYATAYNEASRLDSDVKASISTEIWVALTTEAHR